MKYLLKGSIAFYLFLLLFISVSCDKSKDPTKNAKLPAATQEGLNTLGFTHEDGEVWLTYPECVVGEDPCAGYSAMVGFPTAGTNGVSFNLRRAKESTSSRLSIYTRITPSEGTISSIGEKVDSITVYFWDKQQINHGGAPLPGSRFTVTKYDKPNQIISGEFHLILSTPEGKTVTLSNGRFDFKFNACACD